MKKDVHLKKLEKLLELNEPQTEKEVLKANKEIFLPLLKKHKVTEIHVTYRWEDDEGHTQVDVYQGDNYAQFPQNVEVEFYTIQGVWKEKQGFVKQVIKKKKPLDYAIEVFAEELFFLGGERDGSTCIYKEEELLLAA